ncbi:MAG: hypothetical protein JW891_09890 [Candidatus Lokiarchaeota archaeon]|nr:hypothetical protein [Candidatus Lokiarchaeota archaeon]
MPELEVTELILVTLFPLALLGFSYGARKRKELAYYIPGLLALFITFISTNIEAVAAPEFFNFLEHFCIFLSAILLFFGALLNLYSNRGKTKKIKALQRRQATTTSGGRFK